MKPKGTSLTVVLWVRVCGAVWNIDEYSIPLLTMNIFLGSTIRD